jgi:alkanesulfonate monooxygenase SsuD/methylene tetrahydromethanopterin reductase-like flavin-dependent oxidoreductase (luciferase family)
MDRNLGRIGPMLPPEQADRDYSPAERMALDAMKANAFVGSAQTVATQLRAMAEKLELDELAIITWTYDAQAQAHSYELLAQEFNLKP